MGLSNGKVRWTNGLMVSQAFPDLSGSGFQPFYADGIWNFGRAVITDFGTAHPIDATSETRYMDVGFWAFYEEFPTGLFTDIPDDFEIPDGQYIGPIHFINWPLEGIADDYPSLSGGVSGFYYNLKLGVTVTFIFYTP